MKTMGDFDSPDNRANGAISVVEESLFDKALRLTENLVSLAPIERRITLALIEEEMNAPAFLREIRK